MEAKYLYASRDAVSAAKWAEVSKYADAYNLQYCIAGNSRVSVE